MNDTMKTKTNCPKCESGSIEYRSNGTKRCKRCGYKEVLSHSGEKKIGRGYISVSEESNDALGRYMVENRINEQDAAIDAILLKVAEKQQEKTERENNFKKVMEEQKHE